MRTIILVCCALLSLPSKAQPLKALPHTIIYRTNINASSNVAVQYDAKNNTIIAYPSPTDVKNRIKYRDSALHKGFVKSANGVNRETRFLTVSNKKYSNYKNTPTVEQIKKLLNKKVIITEICDCGTRKRTVAELNKLIDNNTIYDTCKLIKNGR